MKQPKTDRTTSIASQGGRHEALPAFLLRQSRKAVEERASESSRLQTATSTGWTMQLYRDALGTAPLKKPVRNTLVTMLESAGGSEYTTIDRSTLCALTGIRREATITDHWKTARSAGLLTSIARFNKSSVHRFTVPGVTSSQDEERPYLSNLIPLRAHVWLPQERAWWQTVGTSTSFAPPWGNRLAPF